MSLEGESGCARGGHRPGVTVDYVPLGMSVPLYAIILHVLRSCLVTIRTIRTNVLMKHNWMYGKQSSSKSIVFSPKLGNGFKQQGFSQLTTDLSVIFEALVIMQKCLAQAYLKHNVCLFLNVT